MKLRRETPAHLPLRPQDAARARELLTECRFHTTTWAGYGFAMTNDPAVRDEMLDGWPLFDADGERVLDQNDEPMSVHCGNGGVFKYAPGGDDYSELRLPPALGVLSRELHDAKTGRMAEAA